MDAGNWKCLRDKESLGTFVDEKWMLNYGGKL